KQRGGRAFAGLPAAWGSAFKAGATPLYALLSTHQAPAVSFPYNASSLPSDLMARFDESNPAHYRLFNVRSVLGPEPPGLPPILKPVAGFGALWVYDAPAAGYFEVVDASEVKSATRDTFFDINDAWLHSAALDRGQYLVLNFFGDALPPAPAGPS